MSGKGAFHRIPNSAVAQALGEIADVLEIEGESAFRVRAYRSAAQYLANLGRPVAEIAAEGGRKALIELPSVGASIADKILEILGTGRLGKLQELRREVPPELSGLLAVPGLGPKKLHLLHERLGVRRLDDLERALASGEAAALPGFGERSAAKLRDAVAQYRRRVGRVRLVDAEQYADAVCAHLRESGTVGRLEVAVSFRRRRETVGDLDLLAVAADPEAAAGALARFEGVAEVLLTGPTKTSVRLDNGLQIDLRIIPEATFGAALHYFTGSKEHNIALRTLAKKRGFKLSEYGGFRGRRRVAGRTEEEIFALVGAAWIPPELRENRGEIEAAIAGTLPDLMIRACARSGVALEINAHPSRLDLSDVHARLARELGARLVISTDAHSTEELRLLRFGVDVARRAWLTPGDVLNTLPADELLAAFHGERRRRPRRRLGRAA